MQHPILLQFSESDVRSFLREPVKATYSVLPVVRLLAASIVFSLLIGTIGYFSLNSDSLSRAFAKSNVTANPVILATSTPKPAATPTGNKAITATPAPTPEPTPSAPTIPNDTVFQSDLSISAPVIWDVQFDEKTVLEKLRSGVVHMAGTAKPGQKGRVVIFGHSSNYPWVKGDYNSVFAPLITGVKANQEFFVRYNNVTYTYAAKSTQEVKPTDLSVLQPTSDGEIVFITCTPLGTSLRRQIVLAEQVYPKPETNQAFTQASFTGTIPGQ